MKPILLIPVLMLGAFLSVGCSYDVDTIRAEVPGGIHPQASAAEGGTLTLYHVTKFDMWGVPQNAEKLESREVPANTRVGFDYVTPKAETYNADARTEVIAYAGSFRRNLGPIHSMNEKYYWANPNDWDTYWATRPERILAKRATFY